MRKGYLSEEPECHGKRRRMVREHFEPVQGQLWRYEIRSAMLGDGEELPLTISTPA
jgi:hypothetical protein